MKYVNMAKLHVVICCALFLSITQHALAQVINTPYLQSPSESSIWISWKTDEGSTSSVDYGTSKSVLDISVTGTCQSLADNYLYHAVQLTGLKPNTTYYYKVKTGLSSSEVYSFKTQPKLSTNTGHYRILVWGDHQLINSVYTNKWREDTLLMRAKKNVEKIYGAPIEQCINMVMCDGDQVDAGTLDMYENEHFKVAGIVSGNVPIMTCVGNHETYSDPDMANYKAHFFYENVNYGGIVSPGGDLYYAYQQANIVYIVCNTEDNSDTQLNWVKEVVNKANADANVGWIISVAHRPYNCEQYVGDYSQWYRNAVMPVLATSPKSALFVSGHHHLYHRGQTRDWPIYHICDGGASWDQYWGQSNELDMDDIQKTISNWAYQVIDFDLTNKTMEVKSYSIGHPLLGVVYNDKLIDVFHRKLDVAAPNKPSISNELTNAITLPFTFTSSAFSTSTSELFNSTQFQISTTSSFNSLEKDVLRDTEDIYGDSGAPNYTPVDVNAAVDITKLTIVTNGLMNGAHYIRVRHRDANAMWSEWSDPLPFTVTGSVEGNPSIRVAKKIYSADEEIPVEFNFGTGNAKDWLGVYIKGQKPGDINSTQWIYVAGVSGSYVFKNLKPNTEYFVGYFANDGYTEIAPRQYFYVGTTPVLSSDKPQYKLNDVVALKYANAPGQAKDWIGVYKCGLQPDGEGVKATSWKYVDAASGTVEFAELPKGYYYATYMVNDGYTEIASRYNFQVGDTIASVIMPKTSYLPSEDFVVNFADGPGGPKDYLGIFKQGDVAGINPLVTYKYVNGLAAGSITIADDLASGNYFIALFPNDSYTLISKKFNFSVTSTTAIQVDERSEKALDIFPNPCKNELSFTLNCSKAETLNIQITNSLGAVCYQLNNVSVAAGQQKIINVAALSNGVYTLTLSLSTGQVSQRFIKIK